MTDEEKNYIKGLITRIYYAGDFDVAIGKLCLMVGWSPLSLGGKMPNSQKEEIARYINDWKKQYEKGISNN